MLLCPRINKANVSPNPNQTAGRVQVHFDASVFHVLHMRKPIRAEPSRSRLHHFQRKPLIERGWIAPPISASKAAVPMSATQTFRIKIAPNLTDGRRRERAFGETL